jgi:dUTP pyrophosphatase
MTLKFKLDEEKAALLPVRAHATDAGADILTPRSFMLPARSSAIIRTGVHVELPHETVGMLKSRSGLNIFHDIVGEGVIDEGYDGEIVVKLYNLGNEPYQFERGDKIIQLVVMKTCYPSIAQVEEISSGERGSAGYGSTGR